MVKDDMKRHGDSWFELDPVIIFARAGSFFFLN